MSTEISDRQTVRQSDSQNQKGVSLVELLIVVAVIGFLAILVASIPNSIALIGNSKHVSVAREVATKQIEDSRAIGYDNLVEGENSISDFRINTLPNGAGLVTIQDCDLTICASGEELKQIIVKVTWKELGKPQEVKLTTFVSENGL